ncbi:two-component system response regulator LytT [Pedobacter sp. UYP30]|uniref:LytR/AlgR family response regulator transcription factor n=1 Tax=Pedobacter sp. UYP30 TaxID=1756400 RepID=UPI0033913D87
MIRCIAIDDEAYASAIIATFVNKTPFLELICTTTDPFKGLKMVQDGEVDLVFLDIQMPELSGIQFLKICGDRCKVILTTAYSEYALAGFDLDAVDYLLKPISYERFYKAVAKAQILLEVPRVVESTVTAVSSVPANDFMFIKGDAKNRFIKVNYQDILYVEGMRNYLSISTKQNERIVVYQTLRELENQLPHPPFYRVHKSYIISIEHIKMVEGNSIQIGDQFIPISETYRDEFFKVLKD